MSCATCAHWKAPEVEPPAGLRHLRACSAQCGLLTGSGYLCRLYERGTCPCGELLTIYPGLCETCELARVRADALDRVAP